MSRNMSLHGIRAFSLEQMRKEPAILRWREYVSSGGGVRRWRSMTGTRPWMRCVVLWAPKSNGSAEANASPRIITASTWASSKAWRTTTSGHLNSESFRTYSDTDDDRINANKWILGEEGLTPEGSQSETNQQKRGKSLTLASKPVRNFRSFDLERTVARSPTDAACTT